MFMQLGFKWCIHLYYNLLSLYYFDSAVVSIPQLHKHLTLISIALLLAMSMSSNATFLQFIILLPFTIYPVEISAKAGAKYMIQAGG